MEYVPDNYDQFLIHERQVQHMTENIKKCVSEKGYIKLCGMDKGTFVSQEDALSYAIERLKEEKETQKEFLYWFYSGEWAKEGEEC